MARVALRQTLRSFPLPTLEPGQKPRYAVPRLKVGPNHVTIDLTLATMTEFAQSLNRSGRPVIDQTGKTQKFDFHLEFAPEGAFPSDDAAAAPSIFSALEQLG